MPKAKVHPNASPSPLDLTSVKDVGKEEVMTVWRKSLLFNCEGFTVFDGKGDLRYRVDNYSEGRKREIVLMDASGKSLLTIRKKRLSLVENWLIYNGDELVNPLYSINKHVTLRQSKGLAHVTPQGVRSLHSYTIKGSYANRTCTVYDNLCRPVGEVRHKECAAGITLGETCSVLLCNRVEFAARDGHGHRAGTNV